jgi:hypothetical protein
MAYNSSAADLDLMQFRLDNMGAYFHLSGAFFGFVY